MVTWTRRQPILDRRYRVGLTAVAAIAVIAAGVVGGESGAAPDRTSAAGTPSLGQWPSAGQNVHNTRSNPHEQTISPDNVDTLEPKWTVTTTGNVTSTP